MSSDAFFTTRWTRVARSRGNSEEAKLALSELCEAYYDPVHGFIRVTVRDNEKANDLTQGFFALGLGPRHQRRTDLVHWRRNPE